MDLAAFQAGLKAFAEKIPAKVQEVQACVMERAMSDIVSGTPDETPPTPYRTGYARANWMPSVGSPSGAVLPPFHESVYTVGTHATGGTRRQGGAEFALDPSAAALTSLERLPGVIGALTSFCTAYITNNVPYIVDLEHGMPGGSKQAPIGFAWLAVMEIKASPWK